MLNDKQKITNYETLKHIEIVMQLLASIQNEIFKRMFSHDRSKLEAPELDMFVKYTDKLAGLTYGSDEYEQCRQEMIIDALGHHYEHNLHHPEHYLDGIDSMNLIDIVEMLCDWKAATLRHNDGDIHKSLEINAKRFNISSQLVNILRNTIPLLQSVYTSNTQKHLYSRHLWHCFDCGSGGMDGNFCSMCGSKQH